LGFGRLSGHGLSGVVGGICVRGGDEWQAAEQDREKQKTHFTKGAGDHRSL